MAPPPPTTVQSSSSRRTKADDPAQGDPDVQIEAAPIKPPSGPLGGLRSSSSSSASAAKRSNAGIAESQQNPPRARLKYQPKAGIARKTKEERDTLNAKFQTSESSEAGGSSTRGSRGHRGYRGRGPGGVHGDRGRRQDEPLYASGPFSGGNAYNVPGAGGRGFRPSSGGGGSSGARSGVPTGRTKAKVNKEGGGEGGDGDAGAAEMDMEDLSASSDGESKVDVERIYLMAGADEDAEMKDLGSVSLPIRITRMEHVDRQKLSSLGSGEFENRSSSGGSGKGKYKQEVLDPPNSKKAVHPVKETKRDDDGDHKKNEAKLQKLSIQTAEDLEELDRIRDDRASMLKELGPSPEQSNVDEDKDMVDSDSKPHSNHGLYLFQFPPVMPKLISQGEAEADKQALMEAEDEKKVDLTEEPKGTEFPAGIAGKLRVHKSGKVSLLWGDIEFEVHKGLDCEFLQEVVAVEKLSESSNNNGSERSKATSLGPLRGKYIISPDIGQLLV